MNTNAMIKYQFNSSNFYAHNKLLDRIKMHEIPRDKHRNLNTNSSKLPLRTKSLNNKRDSIQRNSSIQNLTQSDKMNNSLSKVKPQNPKTPGIKNINTEVKYKKPILYINDLSNCKKRTKNTIQSIQQNKNNNKSEFNNNKHKINEISTNSQSIFKYFKLKLDSYRETFDKEINRNQQNKSDAISNVSVKQLDNSQTKYFLVKLYNECKRLNSNIVKLYSDKNEPNKINKATITTNKLKRTQSLQNTRIKSRDTKEISDNNTNHDLQNNYKHYYHLACAVSLDNDNNTSDNNKLEKITSKLVSKCTGGGFEMTNVSSLKNPTKFNQFDHIIQQDICEIKQNIDKPKVIGKHKEYDDTLCDLDDEMNTDSGDALTNNNIVYKNPKTDSNYQTALTETDTKEPTNPSQYDISIIDQLPPNPNDDHLEYDRQDNDNSFNIDPPTFQGGNDTAQINNTNSQNYVSIFEKTFQPQFVIKPNFLPNENVKPVCLSNFTSSITVKCSKPKQSNDEIKDCVPNKPPRYQMNNNSSNYSDDFDENIVRIEKLMKYLNTNQNNEPGTSNIDPEEPEDVLIEHPTQRIAPKKNLLMHTQVSEEMSDMINIQKVEPVKDPKANEFIERQKQRKMERQKLEHQKAKDMAMEAAKLRKERQEEIKTFESHDSSRVEEKLFGRSRRKFEEEDVPEFSLFDAFHNNFKKKTLRKNPIIPVESSIRSILPEAPTPPPEKTPEPMTDEQFRNKPLELPKPTITTQPKIDKEQLAKYKRIDEYNPTSPTNVLPLPKKVDPVPSKTTQNANSEQKVDEKDSIDAKLPFTDSSYSSMSSSSSEDSSDSESTSISVPSVRSISPTKSLSSISPILNDRQKSLSSSSSSSVIIIKRKSKNKSKGDKTKSTLMKLDEYLNKSKEADKTASPEPTHKETIKTKKNETKSKSVKKSSKKKEKNNKSTDHKTVADKLEENLSATDNRNRFEGISFDDIAKYPNGKPPINSSNAINEQETISISEKSRSSDDDDVTDTMSTNNPDKGLSTKLNKAQMKIMYCTETQTNYDDFNDKNDDDYFLSNNATMTNQLMQKCPVNFNEKILDRTIEPLSTNVRNAQSSLSGFVKEIISQLESLDDTVDIIIKRMDVLEKNMLDCSRYFVN